MILVYFAPDGCVDDVVNDRANRQFTSVIVVHFNARACWIIRGTVFNVCVCLNHSRRHEHNHFERRDKKRRHQRQFFQNLDNFYM